MRPSRLHETLIARTMDGHLVEHISRDATAIEAREKPAAEAEGSEAEAAAQAGGGPARERRGRRSRAGWNGN